MKTLTVALASILFIVSGDTPKTAHSQANQVDADSTEYYRTQAKVNAELLLYKARLLNKEAHEHEPKPDTNAKH